MRKCILLVLLLALPATSYAQSFPYWWPWIRRNVYSNNYLIATNYAIATNAQFFATNSWNWITNNSPYIEYMYSRTNDWNDSTDWVFSNTNYIQYMYGRTNHWDQSITNETDPIWSAVSNLYLKTNAMSYIYSRTSFWDNAWYWITLNSNSFDYMESRTQYWDWAWDWVVANSNAIDPSGSNAWYWVQINSNHINYMYGRTNAWDEAHDWVETNSNGVDYVFSRTSLWDLVASTAGVQKIIAGYGIGVDPTNGTGIVTVYNTETGGVFQIVGSNWIRIDPTNGEGVVTIYNAETNHVLVKSASDFPAPAGGVITLDPLTSYRVNGQVIVTNGLKGGSSGLLYGIDKSTDQILYTGTNTLLTIDSIDFSVRNLLLNAPSGTIFNVSSTNADTQMEIVDVIIYDAAQVAEIGNYRRFIYKESLVVSADEGFVFNGYTNNEELVMLDNIFNGGSSNITWINITTSVWEYVQLSRFHLHLDPGAYFLKGQYDSENIEDPGGYGYINQMSFSGYFPITWSNVVEGIESGDTRWDLNANQIIPESAAIGSMVLTNQSTVVITNAAVWHLVEDYWTELEQERFEIQTNRLVYVGVHPIKVGVIANPTVSPVTGSNQDMDITIGFNGTPVEVVKQNVTLSSGQSRSVTVLYVAEMSNNDYLEIYTRNNTSTKDIYVNSGVMEAK